jgi:ATP-dependent Lhr-like helicase
MAAEKNLTLYSFTGTRINQTIGFLLNINGVPNYIDNDSSSIEMGFSLEEFLEKRGHVLQSLNDIDNNIMMMLENNPGILDFSKWGAYLPAKYQVNLLKQKYFDLGGAEDFFKNNKLVINQE